MSIRRTLAALALVLVAAGCSAGSKDNVATSSAAGNAKVAAPPTAGGPADAGAGNPAAEEHYVPDQRSIIYTATITVRVTKVDEAATRASASATGAGGFVGGDERS